VEAARGRLVHRVELEQNVVQRYQILAPTEWNFHPAGTAATLLKQLPANNEADLRQQAELVINSVDPCVRYKVVIH
jgi:Ni,Fe-hydrogenase I large subunit